MQDGPDVSTRNCSAWHGVRVAGRVSLKQVADEVAELLPRTHPQLLLEFPRRPLVERDGYIAIGSDDYAELRVAVASGEVVARTDDGVPARFVASTLSALARCIEAYDAYSADVRGLEEDDALGVVDRFEERLRDIDSRALAAADTWWSIIVQQAREGQL